MRTRSNQSFVAEIIGPAGAGKTTLSHLLRQNKGVRTGLTLWRMSPSQLARSGFSVLPDLFELFRSRKRFEWDDVKIIIQYNALLRLMRRESLNYDTFLLDEGTVFALAKLHCLSDVDARSDRWMKGLFDQLVPLLDAVIWLDAPDEVLAQRIRERAKPHSMKDESDAELRAHLAVYRNSYERVVAELQRRNGLKVFKFSTDQVSLEHIAQTVLGEARTGR